MSRDPQFETRRLQNIARMERRLVEAPERPEAWLSLARVRLQQERPGAALVALEHGLWGQAPVEATRELLEDGWPWGEAPDADETERLYGRALGGDDSATLRPDLREAEPRLRVRTAWLLWTLVGTADDLAAARTRLLAALPAEGLAARDLPDFARDSERFATWSRAAVERTIRG